MLSTSTDTAINAIITKASHIDDKDSEAFHNALFEVQTLMGVESGDVAGLMFSGPDEQWREATPEQRLVELRAYIDAEKVWQD